MQTGHHRNSRSITNNLGLTAPHAKSLIPGSQSSSFLQQPPKFEIQPLIGNRLTKDTSATLIVNNSQSYVQPSTNMTMMTMSAVHSEVEVIRSGVESRPDLARNDSLSRPGELRQPDSRPSGPESRAGEKASLRT